METQAQGRQATTLQPSVIACALLAGTPATAQDVFMQVVTGDDSMYLPTVTIANLDSTRGPFAAGNTLWDIFGTEQVYLETRTGFRWSRDAGAYPFELSGPDYWSGITHFPSDIADTGKVVGTQTRNGFSQQQAFAWTPEDGIAMLAYPPLAAGSAATHVSADGNVVYGAVFSAAFGPPQAVFWVDGRARYLQQSYAAEPDGLTSTVVNDIDATGAIAVGEVDGKPSRRAARWRWGRLELLREVAGATPGWSAARFTCAGGDKVLGWGEAGGAVSLIVWRGGRATVYVPPEGMAVTELHDATPDCSAAVGALGDGEDQAPFFWSAELGFTVIGEFGLDSHYDLSRALRVSDDGTMVVGELRASVVYDGSPQNTAFVWDLVRGVRRWDDELGGEITDSSFYRVVELSADGRRVLLEGVLEDPVYNAMSPHATDALLVEFSPDSMAD